MFVMYKERRMNPATGETRLFSGKQTLDDFIKKAKEDLHATVKQIATEARDLRDAQKYEDVLSEYRDRTMIQLVKLERLWGTEWIGDTEYLRTGLLFKNFHPADFDTYTALKVDIAYEINARTMNAGLWVVEPIGPSDSGGRSAQIKAGARLKQIELVVDQLNRSFSQFNDSVEQILRDAMDQRRREQRAERGS